MNTKRSDELVRAFRAAPAPAARTVREIRRTLPASPEEIFPLLCPARERDWIPGWDCELVYTETGYAEAGCVFRTDAGNPVGPGLWVFTRYEPSRLVEIVRVTTDLLIVLRISLEANPDGTTEGVWAIEVTGLTGAGNREVEGLPDPHPTLPRALDALEHYLRKGKMPMLPAHR